MIVRRFTDAVLALLEIAAWDGNASPTPQDISNLLVGMELALQEPEWTLALLNLAGREMIRTRLSAVVNEIVGKYHIEVAEAPL